MQKETRVLVLDDDRGSCLVVRKILSSLGYVCDIAHDAAEGLRAVLENDYSFVLVDCLLPDNTGWVISHAIKLLHRDRVSPIVIGILSYPDDIMKQKCVSSGMKTAISKPISKSDLIGSLVSDLLANCRSTSVAMSGPCLVASARAGAAPDSRITSKDIRSGLSGRASVDFEKSRLSMGGSSSPLGEVELVLQEAGPLQLGELNSSAI